MSTPTEPLRVDPLRADYDGTCIYVRAKLYDKWGSYDIAALDVASLRAWLRSRGGKNVWAEDVVRILLGHEKQYPAEPGPDIQGASLTDEHIGATRPD